MSTYTQPAGTSDGKKYFQDVEMSPATLADGTLLERLDGLRFPQVGVHPGLGASSVVLTGSNATPLNSTPVVLTATVTVSPPAVRAPVGLVTFKDGATTIGTAHANARGVATLKVAGFTTGAHSLTAVVAADVNITTSTSAAYVVTAADDQATLTGASPTTGAAAGGDAVTLTGTHFIGATSATFGGVAATSFVVVNATTITCVTPAHAAGAVTVVVVDPDGNATLPAGFTYV